MGLRSSLEPVNAGVPDSLLARAAALQVEGLPFVLATVTWRRGPSSGRAGSKAIIFPDGRIEGWLGGACAQPTVVREALSALGDGTPRLLVLGDDDPRPGVSSVAMACTSEGAMEVYVEPILPMPTVWIVGNSPAVSTLARLSEDLGWKARIVDDEQDLAGVKPGAFVVVATQGHHDETALEAALGSEAVFVGLVASEKRSSAVMEWLRDRGVSDQVLSRVRAPVGVDLGPIEHHEIAVSILAELVAFKAAGAGTQTTPVTLPETAIDPVCEMRVDVETARWVSERDGISYYFCAPGCQKAFDAEPARY